MLRRNHFDRRIIIASFFAALAACNEPSSPPIDDNEPEYDIIFEGTASQTAELFMLGAQAGSATRLFTEGVVFMDPSPVGDGGKIVGAIANYDESTGDIWIINRDGSGLTQLTHDESLDDHPAVSPNGTLIAFRSHRTMALGDIWVMGIDGSGPVNLTPDPSPAVTDEGRPAWSPNGSRIAYSSSEGGGYDIWTMNANGTGKQRITQSSDFESEPTWSPDGTKIAFRRSTLTDSDIYIVPASGGLALPISIPGHQRMPVWSPDGTKLIIVSQATVVARADLFSVNVDGTGLTPLIGETMPGGSLNPVFLRRQD